MIKPWKWVETPSNGYGRREVALFDGHGRERCTIWEQRHGGWVWHTWDERGTGGENSEHANLNRAKDEAVAAIVRQGWAPGGWTVQW
jgi:hypothetical protein